MFNCKAHFACVVNFLRPATLSHAHCVASKRFAKGLRHHFTGLDHLTLSCNFSRFQIRHHVKLASLLDFKLTKCVLDYF